MYCRGCDSLLNEQPVFEMEPMPLAGGFADTRKEALKAERLPLTWLQCRKCELVQVAEDVPDTTLYGRYCYASSTVPALQRHFTGYAALLTNRFGYDHIRVLEMGCNDGVLLRQLPLSWEKVGVDPSDVAADAMAWDSPYCLYNAPFTIELGLRHFDLVLASNCLAHTSEIIDAVEAASYALKDGGEFWVEVHDLNATLTTGQWDTVYHEHKAEYSLRSLARVVVPHGFRIEHVSRSSLHGGLLRVVFVKGPVGVFDGLGDLDEPMADFSHLQATYANRRQSPLYFWLENEKKVLAYGAAGRATVWLNQLSELKFSAVVDDSPLRVGKFIPGTGLPIVSWEDRPAADVCVITAWNYADRIKARRQEFTGRWVQTWGQEVRA